MTSFARFVMSLVAAGLLVLAGCSLTSGPQAMGGGRTFHVAGQSAVASDTNPGTCQKPWKTLTRAGDAKEFAPGNTVVIHAGTYRQSMDIAVSGAPGRPITFVAAPGERVVIKGSEIIKGDWQQVSREPSQPEPYPNAYTRIWRIKLADKYFYDPARPDYMKDPANRDVTEIVANDYLPWTKTGLSPGQDEGVLAALGRSVADLANQRDGAFFYDRPSGYLYVRCGDPREAMLELGVRGDTLLIKKQHDLVIRGLEMRQSRGNMAACRGASGSCSRTASSCCRTSATWRSTCATTAPSATATCPGRPTRASTSRSPRTAPSRTAR